MWFNQLKNLLLKNILKQQESKNQNSPRFQKIQKKIDNCHDFVRNFQYSAHANSRY